MKKIFFMNLKLKNIKEKNGIRIRKLYKRRK